MQDIVVRQKAEIPQALGMYPGWMAQLLQARGIETREAAEAFLHPSREQILDPLLLHDMAKARDMLLDAVLQKLPVVIYGDYDCDGVCASAILLDTLEKMGADVQPYIPDRHREGYGLNMDAVEELAQTYKVLVTVDCGITSVQEVALAKEKGMQVIVTDHHTVGDALPAADAVVTPHLGHYPFPGLCGAGVAWKLALALAGHEAEALMDIAAMATVADMVPLLQENRAIVKLGLEKMEHTKRPGLVTLMQLAGMSGSVSAQQVAFQLAPRINACGRMDSAMIALEMLRTRDGARGMALARQAHELNEERKALENAVIDEASAQAAGMDLQKYHALVVQGDTWNSGVVGLAAGKLAEKLGYPTVALAREGDNYVGSARSASDVDIYQALKTCEDLFLRFGGHKQAAGMTLPADKVAEFRERLSDAVKAQLMGKAPRKQYLCDGEMLFSDVTVESIQRLNQMEPFGMGNPSPQFLCRHAQALNLRAVGTEGRHLQCTFQQGDEVRKGIFFGAGAMQGRDGMYSLVFSPEKNEFRGNVSAQLQLKHMLLEPESLKKNEALEAKYFTWQQRENEEALPLDMAGLDQLMTGEQGTLLVCRTLETALKMQQRFPAAQFALHQAQDPRAYHTVLLYGLSHLPCAPFENVVLCDGEMGEGAQWQKTCPDARVYALPASDAVRGLASQMAVARQELLYCYAILLHFRDGMLPKPSDVQAFAEVASLTVPQGYYALEVIRQMGLIDYRQEPFEIGFTERKKSNLEQSVLYCLTEKLKEEA